MDNKTFKIEEKLEHQQYFMKTGQTVVDHVL